MQLREYKYALAPTSQFYFCGIPFRLDTTPKCNLDCLYCFAMARGGRRTSKILYVNPQAIKRKFDRIFKNEVIADVVSEMLTHKLPVHFGGLSDPFSNQVSSSITQKLLCILASYDYPVILSTKNSNELLKEANIKLLTRIKHLVVQISVSTCDRRFASIIEPGATAPTERIKSIDILSREGIYCMCRVQPLFYNQIPNVVNELIPRLAQAKCKHVMVEYLKLPVEYRTSKFDELLRNINWNAYIFYKHCGSALVGREWLLPVEFKWENLQPIIDSIHKYGMTYGAADYGLHHLGDTSCCCGIDQISGFGNWFKRNFANIIRGSTQKIVRFPLSGEEWYPKKSMKRIMNSKCRIEGQQQGLATYLKQKWNTPGTTNAPDSFLGVQWSGTNDSYGNCIYIKE